MTNQTAPHPGSVWEVFRAFLWLGLTSFGGPVAHLGYFRSEFVARRNWLDERSYADLVAMCQFLPGPASSQVGFALGLQRAGYGGALAAWVGFTLPSALALLLFALGASAFTAGVGGGIIAGLKVVAVAIVAHAVWGMAKNLCPDRTRAAIAMVSVWVVLLFAGPLGQISAIVLGAAAGWWFCRGVSNDSPTAWALPISARAGVVYLSLFVILLLGLPMLVWWNDSPLLALVDSFYRAGALVFGGGHVVLPLLQAEVVHANGLSASEFLAGYGAAQAVPGPLFTFATYLGALLPTGFPAWLGAALALVAVFVPGLLLLLGVLPFWQRLRQWPSAQSMMQGANAAVVGILGTALYTPVWTSAITQPSAFAMALTGFVLLTVAKVPAWWVVLLGVAGGVVLL